LEKTTVTIRARTSGTKRGPQQLRYLKKQKTWHQYDLPSLVRMCSLTVSTKMIFFACSPGLWKMSLYPSTAEFSLCHCTKMALALSGCTRTEGGSGTINQKQPWCYLCCLSNHIDSNNGYVYLRPLFPIQVQLVQAKLTQAQLTQIQSTHVDTL